MSEEGMTSRYQWSKLSSLQVGRYAEHWAKLCLIEAGYEVYSTEVDDRGIDLLVRIGPGRCLEIQVKGVRKRNGTFVQAKSLGCTDEEIKRRLQVGYCVLFMLFVDGAEPQAFLIPGYAWLTPNSAIHDYAGDRSYGRCFGIRPSKRNEQHLEPYRLNDQSVATIVEAIRDHVEGTQL